MQRPLRMNPRTYTHAAARRAACSCSCRCYERAVATGDKEGVVYYTLASLYEKVGNADKAAHFYRLNYERLEAAAEQSHGSRVALGGLEATQTILYLAQYELKQGNLKEASTLAMRVLDIGDSDAGQAKEQVAWFAQTLCPEPECHCFPCSFFPPYNSSFSFFLSFVSLKPPLNCRQEHFSSKYPKRRRVIGRSS